MIKTDPNTKEGTKFTLLSLLYEATSRALVGVIPIIPSQKRYFITLSHEKKFLWFRVAKVGTRTILNILRKSDFKLHADQALNCHYPSKLYYDYFKFAFVRNPWDRLVSCWKNKVLKSNLYNFSEDERLRMKEFRNFVEYVSKLDIKHCDVHLKLQSELIDLNNIDFIGRFENFNDDLNEVLNKLEIEIDEIEKKNVSNFGKDYKDYYDEELIEIVARIYSKDIMLFSYTF